MLKPECFHDKRFLAMSLFIHSVLRNDAGRQVASEKQAYCGVKHGFEDGFMAAATYCMTRIARADMTEYLYMHSWACDTTLNELTDIWCPSKKYNDPYYNNYVDMNCY